MDDCIFCRIVNGIVPCTKVYEDEKALVFLDISPNNKGHTLVVPKKHSVNFAEMGKDDVYHVFLAAQKVARAVQKAFGSDCNLVMNNGKGAGQVVFHSHVHIIPRFENDGIRFDARHLKYEGSEMDDCAEKIKKHI